MHSFLEVHLGYIIKNFQFLSLKSRNLFTFVEDISCDFEDGLCDFINDSEDGFDWEVITGKAPRMTLIRTSN